MNAEHLLILYERVADAPDAVFHLRRFVLNLAVRGKLVEQNPEDEPVSELLKRILIAKRDLAEIDGQRKKKHLCTQMVSPPFGLPSTWSWASLGTIFQYDAGTKCDPKTLNPSTWLLELQDIEKGTGHILNRIRTGERESKSTKSRFSPGDILYGKLRPYLNKVLVADEAGCSTTEIVAIRPYLQLSSEYCALALRSPYFVEYATRLGQGTKMPRLRTKDAIVAPFPLPPLAEQYRIVEKVDELTALCCQLGEMRTAREKIRDRLTKATLTRISTPGTNVALFRTHARFAIDALPALTARADQINDLHQTILNLAVRGKLVEQNPEDEPASELLKRIDEEKNQLTGSCRTRKSLTLPKVNPTIIPFRLPSTWQWAYFGSIVDFSAGKTPPRKEPSLWNTGDFSWVSIADINDATTLFSTKETVSTEARNNVFKRQPEPPGTMIMSFKLTIGKIAILGIPAFHNEAIISIRPYVDELKPFLFKVLPDLARGANTKKAIKGATLNRKSLSTIMIPLPPLAEQHRIVKKINELLTLCDQLAEVCRKRDNSRIQLLETLLHEALASSVNESA